MAMIAITTSSSTSVNAGLEVLAGGASEEQVSAGRAIPETSFRENKIGFRELAGLDGRTEG